MICFRLHFDCYFASFLYFILFFRQTNQRQCLVCLCPFLKCGVEGTSQFYYEFIRGNAVTFGILSAYFIFYVQLINNANGQ
jgi:Zn-finger protein